MARGLSIIKSLEPSQTLNFTLADGHHANTSDADSPNIKML